MPKTLQVRDLDDDVYEGLRRHAADAGLSVPELLRREATRIARRPTNREWLDRVGRLSTEVRTNDVIAALDDVRGVWPDADR